MIKQICPIEEEICIMENTECENCYIYQNFMEDLEIVEDDINSFDFYDEDSEDEDIIKYLHDEDCIIVI
ncbi:hypothetical protein [Sedimentibacter sp.]|uniref:hypothetical protein n=1 Tax=Sedimentibacter sp. TaxID=1960295 RepID=UPI000EC4898D|nr:hypothetical protein [Sedimentibacter sp.]HCX61317.1 hypothetical protein [Clostridiales bacterium]